MTEHAGIPGDEHNLIGTIFAGRFEIQALLGAGGMGAVYLARHIYMDRPFAVKVIRCSYLDYPSIEARFQREARLAAELDHPNLIEIFDYGHCERGQSYLAMEYVPGPTLRDLLTAAGAFAPERALEILSQVAGALVNFTDTGETTGAVNVPEAELPLQDESHRVLNIHHNVPGVLRDINKIVADMGANVCSQ